MKKQPFGKFQGEKGSKKKEMIRQEKKKARKETKEFFEKKKLESRNPPTITGKSRPIVQKTGAKATSQSSSEKATGTARAGAGAKSSGAPAKSSPAAAMPLNKFIAHAGICSRRDAAEIVKSGTVKVNGQTILEPYMEIGRASCRERV